MPDEPPVRDRIALGIREPWVELILRGIKTLEIRSRPTNVRGPIYLYTSKTVATSDHATNAITAHHIDPHASAKQHLVGVVDLTDCRPTTPEDAAAACVPAEVLSNHYAWSFTNPRRLTPPLKPRFLPYGVWFYPFQPKGDRPASAG